MKRVRFENLLPGDIILTARRAKTSKAIRLVSWGDVSHAMICVQHGSVIDSTVEGVHSRSLQRETFDDDESVFVFRLKTPLPDHVMALIVDTARNEIGARYSKREAARSIIAGARPRTKRQFCSRLVARAYHAGGVKLVDDQDYCTPEELRRSPLLEELPDPTEPVLADDAIHAMESRPNLLQMTNDATNKVLAAARLLDPSIERFQDLDEVIEAHLEWDEPIAKAYRDSGYLDIWQVEDRLNPWRYDIDLMQRVAAQQREELRDYCISTIKEAYSGGRRYPVMLRYYQEAHRASPRRTRAQLIGLYTILVDRDDKRRETARTWSLRHYPDDVAKHFERIEPHTELWFAIVDRVEPALVATACRAIAAKGAVDVCSSCGDRPTVDYRIGNLAEAMPGVPSLRLCTDCFHIRAGFGERLEPL